MQMFNLKRKDMKQFPAYVDTSIASAQFYPLQEDFDQGVSFLGFAPHYGKGITAWSTCTRMPRLLILHLCLLIDHVHLGPALRILRKLGNMQRLGIMRRLGILPTMCISDLLCAFCESWAICEGWALCEGYAFCEGWADRRLLTP